MRAPTDRSHMIYTNDLVTVFDSYMFRTTDSYPAGRTSVDAYDM